MAMVFSRLERDGVSINMHGATRDDGVASSSSGEGDRSSATERRRNAEYRWEAHCCGAWEASMSGGKRGGERVLGVEGKG